MTFLKAITPLIASLAACLVIYLLIAWSMRARKQSRSYNVTKNTDRADKEIKDYLLDLDECERRIS
jgi:hypothetical protein